MTVVRRPLRLLHLVASTDRRGAETAAVRLAEQLDGVNMVSTVMALAPGQVGGLDLPTLGPSLRSPLTLRAARAEVRRSSLVIAHGSSTLPLAAVATAGAGTPFVYRSVGDPRAWVTTPARRARVRVAGRRAVRVVALWRGSAVTWHEVLGVPADRVEVIPNAVEARSFVPATSEGRSEARRGLGVAPDVPVAACIGALSREKRVDLAIDAVRRLPDLCLLVAGDGPEREGLQHRASPLGDRVRFLGDVERVQTVLAAADLLVVPSDTEGQPAVAIEAGLSGRPVVATRVGGLAEVVVEGESGVLVEPGDGAALAGGIRIALARKEAMGAAGRLHCAAEFDLGVVVLKWTQLIVRLFPPE